MQVKPDWVRLKHPAALGSFGHREHNLVRKRRYCGTNITVMPGIFKLVIVGDCLVKEEKRES